MKITLESTNGKVNPALYRALYNAIQFSKNIHLRKHFEAISKVAFRDWQEEIITQFKVFVKGFLKVFLFAFAKANVKLFSLPAQQPDRIYNTIVGLTRGIFEKFFISQKLLTGTGFFGYPKVLLRPKKYFLECNPTA